MCPVPLDRIWRIDSRDLVLLPALTRFNEFGPQRAAQKRELVHMARLIAAFIRVVSPPHRHRRSVDCRRRK